MPAVTDSFRNEFKELWKSDSSSRWISIIESANMPRLDEGPCDSELQNQIRSSLQDIELAAGSVALSGLWLLAGELEKSHSISQDLHNSVGSMWHGIMHCREGDYGNAKYWYRNVSDSDLLAAIAGNLEMELPNESKRFVRDGLFDGAAFVNACSATSKGADTELCQVAWSQWQSLMIYSIQSD